MSSRDPVAYVVDGYRPNGGTYMSYHVARILHKHFGFECRVVDLSGLNGDGVFDYPDWFETVDKESMERTISPRDVLISNPSFSAHMFGLRLRCRRLMYIQGFNTYSVLDAFFDHRVSISGFVSRFIETVYGLSTPVIPAFIHLDRIGPGLTWRERPSNVLLVHAKTYRRELIDRFEETLRGRHPALSYKLVVTTRGSHREFLDALGRYRYFVPLSPLEGFGLTPLEAMASGCTVVGFHGCGGKEYMQSGVNCAVVGYPHLDQLADHVALLLQQPDTAEALAARGRTDAAGYGYDAFEQRWVSYLRQLGLHEPA